MSSKSQHQLKTADTLAALFGSATKARLLDALTSTPGASYHLRGLAGVAGVDAGNGLKTLRSLEAAGLVRTESGPRGMIYQLDTRSPLAEPLRQLFLAASQLMADLKDAAKPLDAESVVLFGSVAKGTDAAGSDIDILVVGQVSAIDAQAAFDAAARKHKRQINVVTAPANEIAQQLAAGSVFWRDVLDNRHIMLKGDELDAAIRGATGKE